MKLKYCDRCACDMPAHLRKCPNCGATNRQRVLGRWWMKIAIVILLFAIIYIVGQLDVPLIHQIKALI
jgi:hypothetical protein